MSFPATLTTTTLTADFRKLLGGNSIDAEVTISSPSALVSTGDNVIVPRANESVATVSGKLSVVLPTTDDPEWLPNGWQYLVRAKFNDGTKMAWLISLLAVQGATQDLADYGVEIAYPNSVSPFVVNYPSTPLVVAQVPSETPAFPRRLFVPPKPMATPPTVAMGLGGAASTITSSTVILATDPRYRYFGPPVNGFTPGVPPYTAYMGSRYGTAVGNGYSVGRWGVEFDCDADELEIKTTVNTATMAHRIMIDHEWVNQAMTMNAPASGTGTLFVKISNGTRKMRRYRLEFSNYCDFYGISLNQNQSTIWRPTTPFGPKVIVIGDSFTEGGDGVTWSPNGPQSYTTLLGDLLGWRVRPAGVSGSGYFATGGFATYRGRVAIDLDSTGTHPGPWDIVMVTGGINDSANTAAQFTAEIPLLYSAIRSTVNGKNSKIVVVLPVNFRAAQQLTQAKVDAIRAAWVATGGVSLIIDPMYGAEGAWFTGTGRVGTPTNNGNADYYLGTDGLHPSSSASYAGGHDYFAYRLAAKLIEAMPF